jgi:prepilin peptidase CpaA
MTLQTLGTYAVDFLLIAGLLHAVFTDLRARRISNRITYPLMLVGLVGNGVMGGWGGLAHSGLGWAAGLGLMLIPFLLGAMGAGDVKLMAAIGAIKGPEFVLSAALYASVAGGLVAIFYVVKERRVSSTLIYLTYGWVDALRGRGPKGGSIPYAPAIAAGAFLALVPMSLLSSWTI